MQKKKKKWIIKVSFKENCILRGLILSHKNIENSGCKKFLNFKFKSKESAKCFPKRLTDNNETSYWWCESTKLWKKTEIFSEYNYKLINVTALVSQGEFLWTHFLGFMRFTHCFF